MSKNKIIAFFMSAIIILTTVYTAQALQATFNPDTINVTDKSALIEWQTDENASSELFFWNTTDNVTMNRIITNMTTNHSYLLEGLSPLTQYKYWFNFSSKNETVVMNNSGNFYEFTTLNFTPPILFINATIPEHYSDTRITITGQTVPNALVHGYANPNPPEVGIAFYDRETFADSDGNFTIPNLVLDASLLQNTVVIWAMDSLGNTTMTSGNVELDLQPANVSTVIPETSRTGQISINGTTNENITVEILVADITNATTNNTPIMNESNFVINQTVVMPENGSLANFSFNVAMPGYKNYVILNARDIGGNLVTQSKIVISDSIPPTFEAPTNLDSDYSPTYTLDVEIKGKLSEQGKVTAFVNGKEQDTEKTDENGRFTIVVTLEKAAVQRVNDSSYKYTYGSFFNQTFIDSYPNYITLAGKDIVGNTVNISGAINYVPCSYGTWFSVNQGKTLEDTIMPSILSPEMLLDGTAQLSYSYLLKWQGLGNYTYVTSQMIPAPVSPNKKDLFDLNWVSSYSTTTSPDGRAGYTVITLLAPDQGDSKYRDKLKNISDHRSIKTGSTPKITPTGGFEESGTCHIPGTGCVKIPMILELHFATAETQFGTQGYGTTAQAFNTTVERVQKECVFMEVSIDGSLFNMDDIPSDYIKKMIEVIDATLAVLEPTEQFLQETERVLVYTYLGFIVGYFGVKFWELFNCQFSKLLGSGEFKIDDAMQNCETEKGKTSEGCIKCAEAIKTRMMYQMTMNWVGDRLFMPSVPTLQKYVKDNWNNKYSWCRGSAAVGDIYSLGAKDYVTIAEKSKAAAPKLFDAAGVKDNKDCPLLHISLNSTTDREKFDKCCGVEYNYQWRSACALLDPLEESACEADQAQYAVTGNKLITSETIGTGIKIQCHPAWNAVAGFCDPQGGYTPEYVATIWNFLSSSTPISTPATTTTTGASVGLGSNKVFFRIVPSVSSDSPLMADFVRGGGQTTPGGYALTTCQVTTTPKFGEGSQTTGKNMADWYKGGASPIQADTQCVVNPKNFDWMASGAFDPSLDCNLCGATTGTVALPSAAESKCTKFNAFIQKLQSSEVVGQRVDRAEACRIYNEIRSKMGVKSKDYIIDPSSPNFFRSVQCIAIPAIRQNLIHWRDVLKAIRQCFVITMTTGDSSPTVCRDMLSQQICDVVFEALKCFSNKYSRGGGQDRGFLGTFGNIMGALTSAGSSVAGDLQSRYGADSLFYSMFGQDKLINAMCVFAFTGEWILDFDALVDDEYAIPINSTVIVTPAERRFVSANPLSVPSGLSVQNYKLGIAIVAGADLTFDVELICSNDYSCSPVQGFEGGKCDCVDGNNGQVLTRRVPMKTAQSLSAGESFGEGGRGQIEYAQFEDKYRYDKVRVTWIWKSSPTSNVNKDSITVPIDEVGGKPPMVCKFDPAFKMFICNLGFSTGGYAILQRAQPTQTVFYVGDNIQIRGEVMQQIPDEAVSACSQDCNYTVFYDVSVYKPGDTSPICTGRWKVPIASGVTTNMQTHSLPESCSVKSDFFTGTTTTGGIYPAAQIAGSRIPMDTNVAGVASGTEAYSLLFAKQTGTTYDYKLCTITKESYDKGMFYTTPSNCIPPKAVSQSGSNTIITTNENAVLSVSNIQTVTCPKNANFIEGGTSSPVPREKDICGPLGLAAGNQFAAAMIKILKTTSGGTGGRQTMNYDARLLAIEVNEMNGIRTVVPNTASGIIVTANGQPQRVVGTFEIENTQTTRTNTGTTQTTPAPATVTAGGGTYTLKPLTADESSSCNSYDVGAACFIYTSSSNWIYFDANKNPVAYSTDSGSTQKYFVVEDPNFQTEIGKQAKMIQTQLQSATSVTPTTPPSTTLPALTLPAVSDGFKYTNLGDSNLQLKVTGGNPSSAPRQDLLFRVLKTNMGNFQIITCPIDNWNNNPAAAVLTTNTQNDKLCYSGNPQDRSHYATSFPITIEGVTIDLVNKAEPSRCAKANINWVYRDDTSQNSVDSFPCPGDITKSWGGGIIEMGGSSVTSPSTTPQPPTAPAANSGNLGVYLVYGEVCEGCKNLEDNELKPAYQTVIKSQSGDKRILVDTLIPKNAADGLVQAKTYDKTANPKNARADIQKCLDGVIDVPSLVVYDDTNAWFIKDPSSINDFKLSNIQNQRKISC